MQALAEPRRAPRACEVLYLGYVDAYWATHALYVTPAGARRLLAASGRWCASPTDYHTHRLCVGDISPKVGGSDNFGQTANPSSWHREHSLSASCLAPNITHASYLHQGSRPASGRGNGGSWSRTASSQASGGAAAGMRLRSPALYGMGHFVQNRSIPPYIHGGGMAAAANVNLSVIGQGAFADQQQSRNLPLHAVVTYGLPPHCPLTAGNAVLRFLSVVSSYT